MAVNSEGARGRIGAEERRKSESDAKEAEHKRREQALDKTLADSFPTSDPPSSIPDPGEEEDAA